MESTYFVVGTSRGLGLELVTQLLAQGSKVIAGARNTQAKGLQELLQAHKNSLTLVEIDIESDDSVKKAAEIITSSHSEGIDYLINNAGTLGAKSTTPTTAVHEYNVNVAGPLRVIQAFLPLVRKGKKKVVVNISSTAGSLAYQSNVGKAYSSVDKTANFYGYRASKAALNCLTVGLASEYEGEIIFIPMHPGAVETDMFYAAGGTKELIALFGIIPANESVKGQLEVIHKLTLADSGKFFSYDGKINPW